MSSVKLTALPSATSLAGSDLIYVVEGSVSKSITKDVFISQFNVEKRTSDYAANADNVGKIWARTDTGEIKTVTDNGGAYEVDQLNRFTATDKTKLDSVESNATQFALIEPRTSDYSPIAANAGKVWMLTNSPTPVIKAVAETLLSVVGTWSAGENMAEAKSDGLGFGNGASAIIAGGTDGVTRTDNVQEWDNVNYSNVNSMLSVRNQTTGSGFSIVAGFAAGGTDASNTRLTSAEEFDGTNWASMSNFSTARRYGAGIGDKNAALLVGGQDAGNNEISDVEEWDDVTWSAGVDLSAARSSLKCGAGTVTAALIAGGVDSGASLLATCESFDGVSWSSKASLGTASSLLGLKGTLTDAIYAGGNDGSAINTTEGFDGSVWTTLNSMNNSRNAPNNFGTSSDFHSTGTAGTNNTTERYELTGGTPAYSVVEFSVT